MADPIDFGLGNELPPLDLGETLGATSVPQSAPNPRQQAKDFAPLLALLPIAIAKGGRVGVAALLQGFQRAREQNRQIGRQESQDQQRTNQIQAQEQYRRDALEQQRQLAEAQRRQQFTQSFTTGLESLNTPEAVRAYLALRVPEGQALGLNPARLEGFAMEQMTPTRLQKKEATRVIEEATKTYKENAPQHVYTLADGTQANWDELNRRAGVTVGASAPEAAGGELTKSSLEVQAAAALARGDMETYNRLLKVKKEMGAADDRPPDPTLQAIRELTLAQQRQLQESGGLTPAKFSQAQALANDFQQETKEFWTQRNAYQRVLASNPSPTSPAGHMALIFAYMKLLDPNSVVRETEYANAQNASAVPDRIRNLYNATINGSILTPRQIADFKNQAKAIYEGAKRGATDVKAIYDQRATSQGLPSSAVTYMLNDPVQTTDSPSDAQAAPPQDMNPDIDLGGGIVVRQKK